LLSEGGQRIHVYEPLESNYRNSSHALCTARTRRWLQNVRWERV